jgi:hypothetical protein
MEESALEQSNQKEIDKTVNMRESGFLIKSENLEEIRPWYLETRSEQTDDDGNDIQYSVAES